MRDNIVINEQTIQNKIYTIRGVQVMLDSDLAMLYQVETKQLNKAVKRNIARFPEHFRFELTQDEYETILRFQIVTFKENLNINQQIKDRKYLPCIEENTIVKFSVVANFATVQTDIDMLGAISE